MNNRWVRAAIPALLLHCSIGTVYCWSTFKETIANEIGMSTFALGWAFSLAIFFLGMSAAFAGRLVEKNIKRSSLISCLCFTGGMIGTGLSINFLHGIPALICIFLSYGVLMGIGLGIGYLTPVKTLMLWFSDNKGLATGISIMGFGLAKAIATPIMEALQASIGISGMFYILGGVYFGMMFLGHRLIKKPEGWVEPADSGASVFSFAKEAFKDKTFIAIWLIFFINIHCGLMLVSYEKQILNLSFAGLAILTTVISLVPSLTAVANAAGRIGYASLSDKMKNRITIYRIIFITSIGVTLLGIFTGSIDNITGTIGLGILTVIILIIINAGYGGGFATLPALLSQEFGMKKISQIHGLSLTAWAVAGITGNNLSEIVLQNNGGYRTILIIACAMYGLALVIALAIGRGAKKAEV